MPFVYDDHRLVLENFSLHHHWDWRALLLFDPSRPLVNLSLSIDDWLWGGPRPAGFHFTNVLLHAVNVTLLLAFARRVAGLSRIASLVPALLWAVHPLVTEGVTYVTGRAELLAAGFMLCGLHAAHLALGSRRAPFWWAVTAACGIAAAFSKETGVIFPVLLLAFDWLHSPSSPAKRRRLLFVHAPLLAAAALLGGALVGRLPVSGAMDLQLHWNLVFVDLDVFRRYLALILRPRGQAIFHELTNISSIADPRLTIGLAVFAIYLGITAFAFRARRIAAFGMIWFVVALVPAAVLVALDRAEPMSERRLYSALPGLFFACGVLVDVLRDRELRLDHPHPRVLAAIGAAVFVILGAETVWRNDLWRNPVALWFEALEAAPTNWVPHLGLADALHFENRHYEAIGVLNAYPLTPEIPPALARLGACQLDAGAVADAERTFARLDELQPGSPAAIAGLGVVAFRRGDRPRALEYLDRSLARDPTNAPLREVLLQIVITDDPPMARQLCAELVDLSPLRAVAARCIAPDDPRVVR